MATTSFQIGDLDFLSETAQTDDRTWVSWVTGLRVKNGAQDPPRRFTATGLSSDDAADTLKQKLKEYFTPPVAPASPWQASLAALLWVRKAPTLTAKALRGGGVLALLAIVSLFIFDYSSSTSPITKNVPAVRALLTGGPFMESQGFFDEAFFARALDGSKTRFWATGVSFRNLVTGNRESLIKALQRGYDFKLVLLDPDSPLGRDEFIQRFSRTAQGVDIRKTLAALTASGGILSTYGKRDKHQVWLSDYAPIVPMVVTDDRVFVSFLAHVSQDRARNVYRASYLTFDADSPMGKLLIEHFTAMLQSRGSRPVYPG